jgi:tetratricopeptide (TPR) repeat protein
VDWRETRTQYYSILYPNTAQGLAVLSVLPGSLLDAEYARFAALFEASLPLPVTLRIYPTETEYTCLNPLAPEIPPGAVHSHTGAREIAFIADNFSAQYGTWPESLPGTASVPFGSSEKSFIGNDISLRSDDWQEYPIDILRYEQAILFTGQVAGGQAPAGLAMGIGHYLQDPRETIGPLHLSPEDWQTPTKDWRDLWENQRTQTDLETELQATSTVAFLVDQFGWEPFLQFLKSLPTSSSYSLSLQQTYQQDLAALQEQWTAYFPSYLQSRWQINVVYNYDLTPYQKLLATGNYVEAADGLQKAIAFLQKINQEQGLKLAQDMLAKAVAEQNAEEMVVKAQQALHSGQYQKSMDLLIQAEQSFFQMQVYYKIEQLAASRRQLREIIALQSELQHLKSEMETNPNAFTLSAQLFSLDQRLGQLGDLHGQRQVRELAKQAEVKMRQQQAALSGVGAVFIFALLGLRIWLLKRKPQPEVDL